MEIAGIMAHEATRPSRIEGGISLLALKLQQALMNAALAELGIVGPSRFALWCKGLGRLGMSSVEVKELFDTLDNADRKGEVSPDALADANLSREVFINSLRHSLDLAHLIQLRYKLLLFACRHTLGIDEAAALAPADLAQLCRRLQIVICDEDANEFLLQLMAYGGPAAQGCADCQRRLMVGLMCNMLAIWSISATKLHCQTLLPIAAIPREPPPTSLAPHGVSSTRDPPAAYIGKTPIEIIVRFKDPAMFPWHKLPEATCGRRFEELWRLATNQGLQQALETVHLLTAQEFDRISLSDEAASVDL